MTRPESESMVEGSVDAHGSPDVPSDAVLTIRLEDASRQDTRAELLGSQVIDRPGDFPVPFAIRYDRSRIDERHTIVVRATVAVEGRLRYTTDRANPVITRGAPSFVDLILVPVGPAGGDGR